MPGRKSWTGLWKAWRRPLLLPAFLLLIALCAAVLPPVGHVREDLRDLDLFSNEPLVRALLTRRDSGTSLEIGGPCRVRDASGSIVLEDGGRLVWDGRAVAAGKRRFEPPVAIAPPRGGTLVTLGRRYAGTLRLVADDDGRLLVTNRVPLETYIAGVISAEMGLHFPNEALKAQAVASRSYAVRRIRTRQRRAYDVGATQATQVYRGILPGHARARRLVAATRAEVLIYDGDVLDAVYSSTCGGHTRPAEEAFGDAAPAPLMGGPCGHCNDAPLARWTATVKLRAVRRALKLAAGPMTLGALRFHPSKRLRALTLLTAAGAREVTAKQLRRLLGKQAKSPWIAQVALDADTLLISGRGFGHGVGLCQYGARGLARRRKSAGEILGWYFPGADRARAW
ncbi:MAG: SpoIID/LytB domain-containing protein [Planctomycetes bacterium]|nr:SpoIID/LytB domain-containing protein [Planctomycetota bacterium]